MRQGKKGYFPRLPDSPAPIGVAVRRRILFGEVDAMAVLWHGHYATLFEEASTELRRCCGLGYDAFFDARLHAPLVQFHVDYHQSAFLDDVVTVRASLIWTDAARLNTEYEVLNDAGTLCATGYSVQLFVERDSAQVCYVCPPMLERCRERWKRGEFRHLS
jgi:acyl-CoA thioester hydrolase